MGIRMLHHRTPEAQGSTPAPADTAADRATPASPVPALAADASTARIPADLATTVRRAAVDLRSRLAARTRHAPDWRAWPDLARGYLALLLTLIPRARPRRTLTVFVVPVIERTTGPGAHRPTLREGPEPGQGATP
ncbi:MULTISPECIES: hypothetical protein [unclassified Streptomyces]|uniref:hypothetical protein n=1 Tax=unclassified Streptomyces TaxID=2593676 RepID=UPI0011A15CA3|nr:hypothetical protein [Streptomyces sp. BK340]